MSSTNIFEASLLKTPEIDELRNWSVSNSKTISKNSTNGTDSLKHRQNYNNKQTLVKSAKNHKKHKSSKKTSKPHDQIGPWKLGKTLGKGSSGRVRLAKNKETGQMAAVKIVNKTKNKNSKATEGSSNGLKSQVFEEGVVPYGIEREIIIMKLVTHPNVMSLFEVWENKSELYLIMEYVDGGELFDVLVNNGKLQEYEAVYYFKQIIQGVSYLHKFNICHRDLKPENILVDKKDQKIKIADFGMAALELSDTLLSTSCGSPHYASPEIIKGMKYNGSPSDVWSCGVILFALLAGYLPFNDSDIKTLLEKVQKGKYEFPDHFTDESKDLINMMLKTNADERILINEIEKHPLLMKYTKTTKNKSNTNIKSLLKEQEILHITEKHRYPTLPKDMNKLALIDEASIDSDIVNSLQILWHGASKDKIIESLLKNEQNEEKFFYSLLEEYQINQHKTASTEKFNEPELEKIVVKLPENEEDYEHAPQLNAVSRFASLMSFSKSQFYLTKEMSKKDNKEKIHLEQLSIDEPKPGLGIYLDNAFNTEFQKTPQKSLYALNSISKRSLHLSNYLINGHSIELVNKGLVEEPLPKTPIDHRNDFSKICENLLFEEENTREDTVVENTFVKMSLDPKLKKTTLKNLSLFLNNEKQASKKDQVNGKKAKSNISKTNTFQDLKYLLSSMKLDEDDNDGETLDNKNDTSELKEVAETFKTVKEEIKNSPNALKRLPTTKSFLFTDLESRFSLQNLDEYNESEGPLIAKRKVIAGTDNSDINGNNSSIGKDLKISTLGKFGNFNNGNENLDFRGSLYITNDSDLNKSSLGEIKKNFLGEDGDVLHKREQPIALEAEDVLMEDINTENLKKHQSVHHNRDSRLLEISLGDITNENLNEIVVDEEFDNEKELEPKPRFGRKLKSNDKDGNIRVTMLFDENEKKFFEDLVSSKEGEKKKSLAEYRNSLKNSNNNELILPKLRNQQPLQRKKPSQKNETNNWFTRLVSRISSGSSSSTATRINTRLSSFLKDDSNKPKTKVDKEEEIKPTVILHERLFNCKKEYNLQTVNKMILNELDNIKKTRNELNYKVEVNEINVITYSINADFDSNINKIDSIRLSIEELVLNEAVTISLSQMRNIDDNNSKKISLFNELSALVLKKV